MRINVGSGNKNKVNAVKDIIQDYDFLSQAKVTGVNVSSDVSNQPKSLDETIQGAKNRAKDAFRDCDLSFGIEDGLVKVPDTKSGYMNFCVCIIFDGEKYHMGMSSAFEYPTKVTELVFREGIDIDEAAFRVGVTDNPRIGRAEGVISLLTKGRIKRKEYTQQAIRTALIHLDNSGMF